ncbi:DNA-binding GntR family transcriptional regulator [Labedella gwakjiensis]|uniref:GntR family transcriptional regulator n=1 Tax=Labedella gwakjiensis TaxID=390269 RepID=A0A2P8GVP2_9MICO|nr:GntR family transcriptional regulator [Labedella gwakjiensis]PSL38034.1 DNA-binding GntR family transcriptional regulator [Labedella gwakjiensis]RUQ87405.1 GntR family transcriptional regulator [Labedella gwakjiensis]
MPIPRSPEPIVATGPLSDEVYLRLGEAIKTEVLRPGERIRDVEVAAWLGVSRTPVREALWRLAQIGLVETSPSRFTRVTEVDADTQEQTLEFTGYQAGIAMHMAVARMTDAELARAVDLVDAVIAASDADDDERLYAESRSLYQHVSVCTRNNVFGVMMREAGLGVERNLRGARPVLGAIPERRKNYEELRAALVERDADRAERVVRRQHRLA